MRSLIIAITIATALAVTAGVYKVSQAEPKQMYDVETMNTWSQWKQTHGRTYGTQSDESYRLSVFAKHHSDIKSANSNPNFTFKSALNKFSDMTSEEFKKTYLKYKNTFRLKKFESLKNNKMTVGASKDWTTEGAVTPVKDQGACGSCWAFSATGALEGLDYLLNGTLRSFSERFFLICNKHYPDMGCNGGNSAITMMWTETNGVVVDSYMPYTPTDTGTCYWSKYNSDFFNKDMIDVPHTDNDELVAAVDRQPISIAVAAEKFMHYQNGIFNDWTCGTDLDHAILLTGYGESSEGKYYSIKNSWGVSWGESGYIRFARNTGKSVGMCGITEAACYPTGQNPKP